MAYQKVPRPSTVYHLTQKGNLDSILDDGTIRRFNDTECWFCESLDKMRAYMEQTVMCEGKPYYAVGGQLCRYPKFVPEDYVLLKLTPSHAKDNWYRWDQEIPPGSPRGLVQAAKEFSMLKIGYRGDMAFRNAEVIDVPLFLTDGITQGEPVQTTSELRELLFEHVEREQREYTDSLYRMTQGQLIANAGEIEANRFCYNALLTMRLDREQLKVLAAMDDPLEAVRSAWVSTQEMRQEEFDRYLTTDDHGMHIIGKAKDQNGTPYFIVKNSWNKYNKFGGYFYASYPYMALKTMDIMVHKNAIPKAIRKKLGMN